MSLTAQDLVVAFKKQPVVFTCGLLIVALLVVIYFRGDLGAAQQAELDELNAEGQRLQKNVAYAKQLAEQTEVLVAANRLVAERAVRPSELARNLQYFYRIETETGVAYTDLRPQGGAPKPGGKPPAPTYFPANYAISVQGDYRQTLEFIRRIERGQRFSRINSFVLSGAAPGKDGVPRYSLSLNIDLLGLP